MFAVKRPSPATLAQYLEQQRDLELSYPEVGATHPRRERIPGGYTKDYTRFLVGHGEKAFTQARERLRTWQMYAQPWLELYPSPPSTDEGSASCVVARHVSFYFVSAFRLVYALEEPRQSAFAIGTLPGHALRGEERFRAAQLDDGSVWVDILAFSTPQHPLVRLGYPLARTLQRRFAAGARRSFVARIPT